MSNNIQILNYNHNVISLSNGNTIIITDNVKGNSISIPQPVTSILQINSPGPQGPAGIIPNTGSFATTGSNVFYGNQIISGTSDFILEIHGANDSPWAFGIYNDTYNPTQSVLASWIDNTGISFLGTEINKPLYIYNNAQYYQPTLIISSSGVTIGNTLTVNSGITGSLEGTASWAITASYAMNGGGSNIDVSSFVTTSSFNEWTGSSTSQFAGTSSYASQSLSSSFATTSSYVVSASYATSASQATSASFATSASYANSSSYATSGSYATSASYSTTASYSLNAVSYITSSGPFSLTGIEVADYSADVAVTFVNNTLKFIFGTPTVPSAPTLTFSGTFLTNRFNRVTDAYDLSGSFTVNGYTLVSASLYTGSVLLAQTGTGTTLRTSLTTSGSQVYRLEVTASSPLDGTLNRQATTLTGTLNKIAPTSPSISATPNVQLGASDYQIEQGATGSIAFSPAYGTSNGYTQVNLVSLPATSPIYVTGSATGSANISITATAAYTSPGTDNVPTLTPLLPTTITYNKIRSVRYGVSTITSFTQSDLENLSSWPGFINKGTVYPYGYQFYASTNAQYIYIVIDSAYTLTGILNVNNSFSNDLNVFTATVVGPYRVYRSNNLTTTSILYELRV